MSLQASASPFAGLELHTFKGMQFHLRPGSSDMQGVEECVVKHVYRRGWRDTDYVFDVLPGERWLDGGANIGAFTVWAGARGAEVVAFEPERLCCRMVQRNIDLNGLGPRAKVIHAALVGTDEKEALLSVGKVGHERRNSLTVHRTDVSQRVTCTHIAAALREHGPFTGVKLNIEGAELAILDANVAWGVEKLAFEYHFDTDRSIPNARRRLDALREQFREVRHPKLPDEPEWRFYPSGVMVYAWGPW